MIENPPFCYPLRVRKRMRRTRRTDDDIVVDSYRGRLVNKDLVEAVLGLLSIEELANLVLTMAIAALNRLRVLRISLRRGRVSGGTQGFRFERLPLRS